MKSSNATYYDRVYLRKYEPDHVRRVNSSLNSSSFLNGHLEQDPYRGNPNELFKSLLKPRNRSNERHLNMSFIKKPSIAHEETAKLLDASFKDMQMYYKPDFRSIGTGYKTISSPRDKEKE